MIKNKRREIYKLNIGRIFLWDKVYLIWYKYVYLYEVYLKYFYGNVLE